VRSAHHTHLEDALGRVAAHTPTGVRCASTSGAACLAASADAVHNPPGVGPNVLQRVGLASVTVPEDFVRAALRRFVFFFADMIGPRRRSTALTRHG